MSTYDAPNQEVVRPDGSGPGDVGEGGSGGQQGPPEALPLETPAAYTDYESMTKDELIALAQSRGISPANATMTKAELVAALEAG